MVRARIGTVSAENTVATGTAIDGEVEDNSMQVLTVMPVRLSEFSASLKQNCTAQITWVTAMQDNVDYFELQLSKDGNNFSTFATQQLAPVGSRYSVTDNVAGNIVYYRLKTVDKNGTISFSNTIIIKPVCGNTGISIFPTITTGNINILGLKGGEKIEVYDAAGRLVKNEKAVSNTNAIDVTNVSNGIYYIVVVSENDKTSFKVVKK